MNTLSVFLFLFIIGWMQMWWQELMQPSCTIEMESTYKDGRTKKERTWVSDIVKSPYQPGTTFPCFIWQRNKLCCFNFCNLGHLCYSNPTCILTNAIFRNVCWLNEWIQMGIRHVSDILSPKILKYFFCMNVCSVYGYLQEAWDTTSLWNTPRNELFRRIFKNLEGGTI